MKKFFSALFLVMAFNTVAFAATTYTFKSGDTLWVLAKKYYGDPTLYTILAKVNGISNPRNIKNGTIITIPNKKDLENIRDEKNPSRQEQMISKYTGIENINSDNGKKGNKSKESLDPSKTNVSSILNDAVLTEANLNISNK